MGIMRLAKKVRGVVEASESFEGNWERRISRSLYDLPQNLKLLARNGVRTTWERKIIRAASLNGGTISVYEEVRMKASQCEEGCFKAIEGNTKEYHIREGSHVKSSSVSEVSSGSRQWRPYRQGRASVVVDVKTTPDVKTSKRNV
ncbi:hypothetical protein Tco_0650401 [Tanacetum coccineum]